MTKTFKKAIALVLSVLMLVSAMPFTAMTAMAADKVVFDFSANKENTSGWAYDSFEENGHWYDVMASNGSESYSIADSKINFNHAVAFCNDSTVRDYVQSNSWTVEFTSKANDAGDYTFYGLGGADGDFVRLDTNGSFMANGIWTNVAINSLISTDYAISYNGSSVKLYVNGIEVASINTTLNVKFANNGTLYSALGWTDTCGKAKIYGQYTSYSISDTAFDADAYIMSKITADLANNTKAESFNANAYHTWNVADGGFSNVVYQKSDSTAWNSDYVGIKGFSVKIAIPSNIVLAYDGVNDVKQPVVLETKSSNGSGGPVIRTAFPTDRTLLAFADEGYWRGDHNTDYSLYRYNDTTSKIGYAPYRDKDTESQNNKNTPRFWYNTLSYVGNGNTETYFDHIGTLQWNIYAGDNSSNCQDNFVNSYGNTYVINYKPAYDILNNTDFKTLYNKVYANQSEYTADSLKAYLVATYKMATLNVNASFGSVTSESIGGVVASVANEIKTATTEYNSAVANLQCAHINTTIKNKINPTATQAGNTGDTYCSYCDTKLIDGTTDPATGDFTNYDAVIAKVNAVERDKYTDETLTTLDSTVKEHKNITTTAETQADIDAAVTAIQTALNGLALKGYTVTVYTVDGDTETEVASETVKAGGVYTANVAGNISKWTVSGTSADKKVGTNSNTVDVIINEDTDIYAFIETNVTPSIDNIKVTYLGYLGKVVAVDYTNEAPTSTTNKENAEKIPFYTFQSWTVNKTGNYTYTMVPNYTVSGGFCNVDVINSDIGSGIYGYDESVNFKRDEARNAVEVIATFEDSSTKSYIVPNTGFIHLPYSASKLTVNQINCEEVTTAISGSFAETDETGTPVANFNATYFSLDETSDYTNVEAYGVIMTVNPTTANNLTAFKANNNGVLAFKGTSKSMANEFTISVHSTFGGKKTVYARSFVKLANGDIIYSDDVTALSL